MGPRQAPDKRHTAYETIFGHPGVLPHQQAGPPLNYPPSHPPPPPNQPFQYMPQKYPVNIDRRTSYNTGYMSPGYPIQSAVPQGPPSGYRQSYYPTLQPPPQQPPQQHPPPPSYAQYNPGSFNGPSSYNPALVRARSMASNPQATGIILSPPDEPPDRGHDPFQQPGLTPAQAYQAQIHLNSPSGSQGDWNRYRSSPGPADRNSHPQSLNGGSIRTVDTPRLGVTLEHDDGRLGLDFGPGSGNSSDQGTDEGSSELPWARQERTCEVSHVI